MCPEQNGGGSSLIQENWHSFPVFSSISSYMLQKLEGEGYGGRSHSRKAREKCLAKVTEYT